MSDVSDDVGGDGHRTFPPGPVQHVVRIWHNVVAVMPHLEDFMVGCVVAQGSLLSPDVELGDIGGGSVAVDDSFVELVVICVVGRLWHHVK